MALQNRKKLILAKKEVTYGVDAVPTGSAAVLVTDVNFTPLDAEIVDRKYVRPYMGASAKITAGAHCALEFSVEFAAAGAKGTAPQWGALMLGCGMSETVNAGVSVEYDPVSDITDSLTIIFNLDGQEHMMLGCRGSFTIEMNVNDIPKLNFKFMGLYSAPTSDAAATPDFTGWRRPLVGNTSNFASFSLHGYNGAGIEFSMDAGQNTVYHATTSSEKILITDRDSKGKVVMEAPVLTAKNWFVAAASNNVNATTIQLGSADGEIVMFTAPKTGILSPKYGEKNGVATIEMDLYFQPNTGNDEFRITTK